MQRLSQRATLAGMKPRQAIIAIAKALVLLILLGGILYYFRVRQSQDVIDDAADDLVEQTGDTYVPVHVTQIVQKTIHRLITAYGRVEPAPASAHESGASAVVSSPAAALVATVDCIEGQAVEKGQKLFTLDDRAALQNAAADQAAADAARTRAEQSKSDAAAPAWIALQAQRDLDQATATFRRDQAQLAALSVTAPIAGIVTQLAITPGSIADSNRPSLVLIDPHRLVVALDVSPQTLTDIKIGDDAFASFGQSKVTRIDTSVDPQSGLGTVDVALPADTSLRAGQSLGVQIAVETHPNCLIVPRTSIVMDADNHPTIAVIDESGRWAVRKEIECGITDGDVSEINGDGVQAGQSVVTGGAYGLTERTRVNLLRD